MRYLLMLNSGRNFARHWALSKSACKEDRRRIGGTRLSISPPSPINCPCRTWMRGRLIGQAWAVSD